VKLDRARLDRLVTWSPVMLLGAFAVLTYWLDAQIEVNPKHFDGSGRHDPDLIIENFHAVSLDAQGRVRQALDAVMATHYPDDDTTEFDKPVIVFSDPDKPRLTVSSQHAMVTGDRENAYFSGAVRGVRDPASPTDVNGAVVLTSEYMHVIPKQDRVESDKPVRIEDARGIINATGMEFDNKTKKLKFGSQVHGQFAPQKQP
jgi:lipopolysaccharide export system protein LptC